MGYRGVRRSLVHLKQDFLLVFRLIVKSRNSLSRKIFIYYMVSSTVIVLLFGAVSSAFSRDSVIDRILDSSQQTVIETGKRMELLLEGYRSVTAQVVSDPELQALMKRESTIMLGNEELARKIKSKLAGYAATDDLMRIELFAAGDKTQEDWYAAVSEGRGKAVWLNASKTGYLPDKMMRSPVFAIARMFNERGTANPLGLLLVEVNTHDINKELTNVRFDGEMFIINSEGMIMFAADPTRIEEVVHGELFEQMKASMSATSGSARGIFIDGEEQLFVYHSLPASDWTLIGYEPLTDITKEAGEIWLFTAAMVAFSLLLTGLLGILVIRRFGAPLHKLSKVMNQSRSGDLSVRADVTSDDEIGEVGRSLNKMMDDIQALMKESEQAVALRIALKVKEEQRMIGETLRQFTAELSSTLELDEVLSRIPSMVSELAGVQNVCVWGYAEGADGILLPVARMMEWREESDSLEGIRLPKQHVIELLPTPITPGELIRIEPNEADSTIATLLQTSGCSECELSMIPFGNREELKGILTLSGSLTEYQRTLLALFAAQINSAVMNALLYRQMRTMATIDALTGVNNRRSIFAEGERFCERIKERGMEDFSVILFDVDHFKRINDEVGHPAGDEALRRIARCTLTKVGERGQVGRYGGEEFAVLLPDTGRAEALLIAEEIRQEVEHLFIAYNGTRIAVTVSLGVATADPETASFGDLLSAADQLLYRAKREGRNRVG
ncbi:diguanylate cyclase [Paenibacillus soyae]|uniref:Diguanylate cyclase n=1 Tax=Paenibacillus soyae TaxID=2969249 RepID=A0A9X2MW63_9BACL|nr:diguanylate cyclase [Paenibacillus soyae]MCR2807550.1 diguanylate cyclase [Paenibacillus soyae]